MTDGHPQHTVNVSTFIPEGFVFVGFEPEDEVATATKLLAAAGDNYGAVMAQSGGFLVPSEVAIGAGFAPAIPDEVEAPVETPAVETPAEEAPAEEAPVEAPAPAPAKKGSKAAADPAPADTAS